MSGRLVILCCRNFLADVAAGVTAEGWTDVSVAAFPVRCGRPPLAWDELQALLPADCTQLLVLGRACLQGLGAAPAGFPPTRCVSVQQCFHIVAGETLVDDAIASGGYLITPAWLADWRGQLATLGFTPEQAGDFFHDFAKELVLLDTGTGANSASQLAELQAAVKLPSRVVKVGLDATRLKLARWVLEWRLEQAERNARTQAQRHSGELADHVAAMDMLAHLARTQHEDEAIAAIADLFNMLFAPAALHYLRVEHGIPIATTPIPAVIRSCLDGLHGDHDWLPDGAGFMLRIARGAETLGLLAVDRLAFPQYRERYLNLALAVTGVCGLAIENARNRKRLLEAEKMASLGIVVAGVAHEVNTPLGICLAAASTLQSQSRQISERFVARSMTQSDLTGYLENATTGTGLIRQNLERIGHLVDTFRQVVVTGHTDEKHAVALRECLDNVLRSLGDRLPADRFAVDVDCPPDLVVDASTDDWVSIFINLVSNSLKHGFRGREHGTIRIRIIRTAKNLQVDYHDDGNGMGPEAQARIFDPFFTTDLQQGMGLGMHLVYNLIVHRMGGSIVCDSTPGQGVRFHIEIPA